MPIGEDDIMFEESWTSPTVLLDNATTPINEADLDEKASPLSTTSTVFTDAAKLQCPICRRILPSKEFGQCIGAPTSEFPVLRDQNGMTSRKRKRTESRTAHETRSAPCHDCLDNLGEEEGETWGRCDNPNCWSRGDQAKSRMSGPFADEDDYPFFGRSMLRPTPSSFVLRPRPQPDRPANPNKHKLGLVCPQCSPEGGLGCSHKWICDVCAFWEKQPLVWECPGCLNDYCDECEEVCFGGLDEEERCFECGKRDLCRGCRENFLSGSPSSEKGLHDFDLGEQIFSWRCQLCNFPVCTSCLPSALANRRIDSCRNCCSHLCGTCRSLLACQRCGGEMCQLCLGESLAMLCRKCEHGD
ncbi:hypothetical protein F5878DRAFT_202140 [Lentinula raphanica]|uniref:Uncharacterized protein n=1 Tax=Lentinula raphanica TaxID=153919 RepID=A0AA38P7I7_9AGAR|nr:hypothetical protein F5878DRAFT_202140 [Lentinula raphanica]